MSMLYLSDGTRLKSYASSTKGATSVVRIEIAISDPLELGYFLRELQDLQAKQKQADRAAKAKPVKAGRAQLALPAPALALPYFGVDE